MIQYSEGRSFSRPSFRALARKVRGTRRPTGTKFARPVVSTTLPYLNGEPDGLGFSLKPPKFLRNAVASIVRNTKATVPTPGGPVVVDFGNPDSVAAAKAAAQGIRIETGGSKPAGPLEQANATVTENVPGGWLTIAAGAALALALFSKRGRR